MTSNIGATPVVVVLATLAILLASLAFGIFAAVFPDAVVKAQARVAIRFGVVRRNGRETVLPEWVALLKATTQREALDKLRAMIEDPSSVVPRHVQVARVVGLFVAGFSGFVLLLFVAAFLGWIPSAK